MIRSMIYRRFINNPSLIDPQRVPHKNAIDWNEKYILISKCDHIVEGKRLDSFLKTQYL